MDERMNYYYWKFTAGHRPPSARTAAWWTRRKCNRPRQLISPCTTPRPSRAPRRLQHLLDHGIRTGPPHGTIPPGTLDTIGISGIRDWKLANSRPPVHRSIDDTSDRKFPWTIEFQLPPQDTLSRESSAIPFAILIYIYMCVLLWSLPSPLVLSSL